MRSPSFRCLLFCLLSAFAVVPAPTAYAQPASGRAQQIERSIDSLIVLMTLEEKVGQLQQYTSERDRAAHTFTITPAQRAALRRGAIGSLLNVEGAEVTRELQRIAVEETRMKIPLIFGLDVIHGFRTTFPIPLAEASSWDPAAVERSARVAATEASAAGIHWTFAPMVDIARDPRWGRIAEGSGEDPYLGSVMAAARVKGFQGSTLAANNTIAACLKHFAAYGGAEGGRDYNTVDISEQTLRDVYLPPFATGVSAGAATLMCSFNEINGVPSSANRRLLTDILRGEWGFKGFVVSDWNSIGELVPHGIAATRADAARLGITAGVDMDMEGKVYGEELAALVKQNVVPVAAINEAVKRILRVKYQLGLFDDPYRYCDAIRERMLLLHPAHRGMAREMAQKSIVLLKNSGQLLPLQKEIHTLAVVGPLADDSSSMLGPWSASSRPESVVTVMRGVREAIGASRILFARGCAIDSADTSGFSGAVAVARRSDVVLAVVGESADMSGEARSRSSLGLPGVQEQLLHALHATGKPLVVVLMSGRPLAVPWAAENVPALIEGWFLGVEAGHAIADVLFGDVNPSGKLPVTVPRSVGEVPFYYYHKNTGRPGNDSDRFTSKYIDQPLTPLFPFGYGLSYTTFTYSNMSISAPRIRMGDSLTVAVMVSNSGKRQGEEVVQLYIRDDVGSLTRPVKQLKAFRKIALPAGEARTVRFTLSTDQLAFTNGSGKRVTEPGTFTVYVGGNSVDVLEGKIEIVMK